MKRSRTDKVIAGVCGGIGKHTGINPWLFRILFLILGVGFLFIYFCGCLLKKKTINYE